MEGFENAQLHYSDSASAKGASAEATATAIANFDNGCGADTFDALNARRGEQVVIFSDSPPPSGNWKSAICRVPIGAEVVFAVAIEGKQGIFAPAWIRDFNAPKQVAENPVCNFADIQAIGNREARIQRYRESYENHVSPFTGDSEFEYILTQDMEVDSED